MKRFLVVVLFVGFLTFGVSPVLAQEEAEEAGHVFAISTYKVQFGNVEKVLEMWEEMWKPVYTKNEHVKSFRVFTHLWGSDWMIVTIVEYESLSAIEAAQKRGEEIRKEVHPDEEEWQAKLAKVQKLFLGHTDEIVTEVPSLRK